MCQQDGVSIKLSQPTQTPTEKLKPMSGVAFQLLILSPNSHLISIQGNGGPMVIHNASL